MVFPGIPGEHANNQFLFGRDHLCADRSVRETIYGVTVCEKIQKQKALGGGGGGGGGVTCYDPCNMSSVAILVFLVASPL